MTPRRQQRIRAFTTYRALGGNLSLQEWLAQRDQRAQAADAIVLPRSFWWAVGICGLSAGAALGIVGRAAGWW